MFFFENPLVYPSLANMLFLLVTKLYDIWIFSFFWKKKGLHILVGKRNLDMSMHIYFRVQSLNERASRAMPGYVQTWFYTYFFAMRFLSQKRLRTRHVKATSAHFGYRGKKTSLRFDSRTGKKIRWRHHSWMASFLLEKKIGVPSREQV